jgi:hypothetical protein
MLLHWKNLRNKVLTANLKPLLYELFRYYIGGVLKDFGLLRKNEQLHVFSLYSELSVLLQPSGLAASIYYVESLVTTFPLPRPCVFV